MKYWRTPLDQDENAVPRGIVHIIEERCKGCGFCIEFCPRGVLKISSRINAKGYHPPEVSSESVCADCGLCALICPDFAIYVVGFRAPPLNGDTQSKPVEPGHE